MIPRPTLPDGEKPKLDPALEAALNQAIDVLAKSLNRWLRLLTTLLIVMVVGVGGLAVYVAVKAAETRGALCHLRQDLQQRVAQSEDFVKHPERYPGVHIDPAQIQPQIDGQHRTIESLSGLGCEDAVIVITPPPSPTTTPQG